MAEKASPREIAEILRREMTNKTTLSKIDEDFLNRVKEYLKDVEEKIEKLKELSNPLIEKEIEKIRAEAENVKKMIEKIFVERCRKIVYLALAYSETHPKLAPIEDLLPEEKQLFEEMSTKIYQVRKMILDKIFGYKEEKYIKESDAEILVRILEDIEEFAWEDGEVYGPYNKDDLVKLPKEVVEILKEKKKIEVVT